MLPDVIIVGGGHNGLVAATYLARAGYRVSVFEARPELGGAVASAEIFEGCRPTVSLLLPDLVATDHHH
jgi:phytoene dehydrogenase-like protein